MNKFDVTEKLKEIHEKYINSVIILSLNQFRPRLYDKMMKIGLFGACVIGPSFYLENGLAKTPPMGWLSWQRYECDVDAKLIRETADAMTAIRFNFKKSLKDVGYKYVNIDDCWSLKFRDTNGDLFPDPVKFPKRINEVPDDDGIKSVSKYLHHRELFFGLYTDIGTSTCQKYPGLGQKRPEGSSEEPTYLKQDVKKFVEWGIDALKVDGCNADISEMGKLYSDLSDELIAQTNGGDLRRILLSCSWPAYRGREGDDHCENEADMAVLMNKCNLWRNFSDIEDSWSSVGGIVKFWARRSPNNIMVKAAGPGHWNDPDMLVIGNPGLSISEQKAQFALWAIIAAPLYMSVDVANMPEESYRILMNEKVIAINQDIDGKQGFVAYDEQRGSRRIWVRLLNTKVVGCPRIAVLFENKSTAFNKIRMTFKVEMLGWMPSDDAKYTVEDVHTNHDPIEIASREEFTVAVDESSVEMFVFTWLGPSGSADPNFFAEDKHLPKERRTRGGASSAVAIQAI